MVGSSHVVGGGHSGHVGIPTDMTENIFPQTTRAGGNYMIIHSFG